MPFSRPTLITIALFLAVSFLTSCHTPREVSQTNSAVEQAVRVISLQGPITNPEAEISGLTWYGDYLIILSQYPAFPSEGGGGQAFALPKADILAYLEDASPEPLTPFSIAFDAPDLRPHIANFEGYEAIVFDGNKAYLTIEAEPPSKTRSYLVTATIAQDLSTLKVDTTGMVPIYSQSDVENMAEETLILTEENILSVHEANGKNVNATPVAHVFDLERQALGTIPFPAVPYRITDATTLDKDNRFWAINYHYPDDQELYTSQDPLAERYGRGATHAGTKTVERLVEFQYTTNGIKLTNTPPIQLELLSDDSRNWEGLARLDDKGFLIMTDKFPNTTLGFVQKPK